MYLVALVAGKSFSHHHYHSVWQGIAGGGRTDIVGQQKPTEQLAVCTDILGELPWTEQSGVNFQKTPGLIDIIRTMYFGHWEPLGMSEQMWSENLEAPMSGEFRTLGRHTRWPRG
jgi:hypothetical protein